MLSVRSPIVLVDVEVFGRDLADRPAGSGHESQPLIVDFSTDCSGLSRNGFQGATSASVFRVQERQLPSIGRPAEVGNVALQGSEPTGFPLGNIPNPDLVAISGGVR